MLEVELDTYAAKSAELKSDVGKFVLIQGSKIIGVYQNHEQALKQGKSQFGTTPFLVKQIEPQRRLHNTCTCPECL